ncbi:class I SAM-dependent methyltransferase [uncultured Phenylobacterium sp.]|uniref:class I SAM-dependent methyltransferase n=1 Tax=uncultured Phenylobacterium sp. TaxID=349273 RepID=UPI0025F859C1|nr:class I SAM-dependent methyltransferase [uncultured Phenylobacterium sp.]
MSGRNDGYLAEHVYPSNFPREFSPAWVDAMLCCRNVAPPRAPRAPFALLDLGCGDGMGLTLLAAAYPEGRFTGIDAMPAHVANGQAAAARLGIDNVDFRCALFSEVEDPAVPSYDYVTAQGVIAWVSAANRDHVYRIAASHLRPDGVAVLGYNAMPWWKDVAVFQHTALALAETEAGGSVARFDAAVARLQAMRADGASPFSEAFWTWFDTARTNLPHDYFPHEYLNTHWAPLWSDQVAGAMAARGFVLAGPGGASRLREDFAFRAADRRALAGIAQPTARELMGDVFSNASFRIDIFARPTRVGAAQARLDGWWAAMVSEAGADYGCATPAGRLKFDNAAAHAILGGLEAGPRTLRALHAGCGGATEADILNAADALLTAGHIAPAEPPAITPCAEALNAETARAARHGEGVKALAGRNGAFAIGARSITAAFGGESAALAAIRRLGVDIEQTEPAELAAARPG